MIRFLANAPSSLLAAILVVLCGALLIGFYAVSTPASGFESTGWRVLGMAFGGGLMFLFVLQEPKSD